MKKIYALLIVCMLGTAVLVPQVSLAVVTQNPGGGQTTTGLPNPLGESNGTIYDFVVSLINIFLRIGVIIAAGAFIYSGFLFVTAQGNPKGREEASTAFFNTIIGTALLLGAWGLAQIIKATIDGIVG